MQACKRFGIPLCGVLLLIAGCRPHSSSVRAGADWTGPIDPVCGVGVPVTAEAIRKQHEGREFLLCSESCAGRFAANPSLYRQGYCACPELHPDCECGHCQDVKARRPPAVPCDCD